MADSQALACLRKGLVFALDLNIFYLFPIVICLNLSIFVLEHMPFIFEKFEESFILML